MSERPDTTALLIETNRLQRRMLAEDLSDKLDVGPLEKTAVIPASCQEEALQIIQSGGFKPSIVLLDREEYSSVRDVKEGIKLIRERSQSNIPTIMRSPLKSSYGFKADPEDVKKVLDAGADQYILKQEPFEATAAYIKSAVRRSQLNQGNPIEFNTVAGILKIRSNQKFAIFDGQFIVLSPNEQALLMVVAKRVTPSEEILESFPDRSPLSGLKMVHSAVYHLRRKLRSYGIPDNFIKHYDHEGYGIGTEV